MVAYGSLKAEDSDQNRNPQPAAVAEQAYAVSSNLTICGFEFHQRYQPFYVDGTLNHLCTIL